MAIERERCEACKFSERYRSRLHSFLYCIRFPPSVGNGDSPFDQYSLAKFPVVDGDWYCGEWAGVDDE